LKDFFCDSELTVTTSRLLYCDAICLSDGKATLPDPKKIILSVLLIPKYCFIFEKIIKLLLKYKMQLSVIFD